MIMKNIFSALVLLFVLVPSVQGQINWLNDLKPMVVKDTTQKFSLGESMVKNHVNSLSLAVIEENGDVQTVVYSNDGSIQKIDVETRYQAGSISKPVAALGVMALVKKYNLDLDARVNQYLKSWKIESKEFDESNVTIRNLLSHTAGLTVHGFMGYRKAKKVPEITEILSGKGNSGAVKMNNHADSAWRYSGGGYEILHLLIEDVSGEDFAAFLQREVLTPIGMSNSTYDLIYEGNCNDCAHAYNRSGKAYKESWYLYPESAAAGLWTTSGDLVKFMQYMMKLYQGEDGLISTDSVKEMLTPVLNNYGFGFTIYESNDETYIGHSGKNIGFSNDMCINLETGEGFVCMTDSDGAFPLIEDIKRSIPGSGIWTERPQVVIVPVELSAQEMEALEGIYVSNQNRRKKLQLTILENNLALTYLDSKTTHLLIPKSKNEFVSEANGISIKVIEEDGQQVLVWNNRMKLTRK